MQSDPTRRIAAIVENAPAMNGAASAAPAAASEVEDDFEDEVAIPEGTDWSLVRLCAAEPQNDIGNSRRLPSRCGEDMLHVQNIGWHVYDGRRWLEDINDCGTSNVPSGRGGDCT